MNTILDWEQKYKKLLRRYRCLRCLLNEAYEHTTTTTSTTTTSTSTTTTSSSTTTTTTVP